MFASQDGLSSALSATKLTIGGRKLKVTLPPDSEYASDVMTSDHCEASNIIRPIAQKVENNHHENDEITSNIVTNVHVDNEQSNGTQRPSVTPETVQESPKCSQDSTPNKTKVRSEMIKVCLMFVSNVSEDLECSRSSTLGCICTQYADRHYCRDCPTFF